MGIWDSECGNQHKNMSDPYWWKDEWESFEIVHPCLEKSE